MVESLSIAAIDRAETLRYLGYRGQVMDDALEARIAETLELASSLIQPRTAWQQFAIAGRTGDGLPAGDAAQASATPPAIPAPRIILEGTTLQLEGHHIARHLEGAHEAVALAVTVGLGIDRELGRLARTNPAEQAILDAAGTAAVEQAADAASAIIRSWAEGRGLHAGPRFSPGYGDLPLAVQPSLLAAVDATRRLGITLSASLLMKPVKSITAIIGIFDDAGQALRAARRSGAAE